MRRAPLSRKTPIRRGKPPVRVVQIGRSAERRQVKGAAGRGSGGSPGKLPGEFTPRVKLLVRKRAGRGDIFDAACEACGAPLGDEPGDEAGDYQHRAARGAGGCRDVVINGPANCALMCRPCHDRAEAREPDMGMDARGFWIGHGTTAEYDPRNAGIMLASAGGSRLTVWLAGDGLGPDGTGYLLEAPEVTAKRLPGAGYGPGMARKMPGGGDPR